WYWWNNVGHSNGQLLRICEHRNLERNHTRTQMRKKFPLPEMMPTCSQRSEEKCSEDQGAKACRTPSAHGHEMCLVMDCDESKKWRVANWGNITLVSCGPHEMAAYCKRWREES